MLNQVARFICRTPVRTARRRAVALVMLISGALNAVGCYSYASTGGVPGANEHVRARLSPAGQVWLLEQSGRARGDVEGTLVRADAEQVLLTVWRSDLPGSTRFMTGIDTLRIPMQHIAAFEQRRLSAGRTILAGAVAAGVLGLAIGVMAGAGGSGDGDGGGTVFLNLQPNR